MADVKRKRIPTMDLRDEDSISGGSIDEMIKVQMQRS